MKPRRQSNAGTPTPDFTESRNLSLLENRLALGYSICQITPLPDGVGPLREPSLLVELQPRDRTTASLESILVGDGPDVRALIARRAPHVDAEREPAGDPRRLATELARRLAESTGLGPERRAAQIMDWVMAEIGASRCALIPFEGGSAAPPLAFRQRDQPTTSDLKDLPRKVVERVARSRQPLIEHDLSDPTDPTANTHTLVKQRVRSFMAVPVVFRHELLAVAYVDRLDRPRPFDPGEQVMFQALAYELATPLLSLREERRKQEYEQLRDDLLQGSGHQRVITSPGLETALARARSLAAHQDLNLLLLGETGVGKEWVARMIHAESARSGPFVAVNLSVLPTALFEAELMGAVRGAFTGAIDRPGRIRQAEGGTLFLDEIGDLDLLSQVKLLRFLQDRRFTAVGDDVEQTADVRIVAATNRPIREMVRTGAFRTDLLHRFAPPLHIPSLTDRREEILPHSRAWLASRASRYGLPLPALCADARAFLEAYRWPGNVRQLQAVLSSALLVADGRSITRADLEALVADEEPITPTAAAALLSWEEYRAAADAAEAAWLRAALRSNDGNVAATSRSLGCPDTTLRHLIRRHGGLARLMV